jgi:hypothetical protein
MRYTLILLELIGQARLDLNQRPPEPHADWKTK